MSTRTASPSPATTRSRSARFTSPCRALAATIGSRLVTREPMAATPEQVRSVIQQYADAWARNDRALLISLFANNAKWLDPVGTPAFTGHPGVAAFWEDRTDVV